MKIAKFGGRSLGNAARMQQVINIITASTEPQIVVLSAIGGTSQMLRDVAEALQHNRRSQARNIVKKLEAIYKEYLNELLHSSTGKANAVAELNEHFQFLHITLKLSYSEALSKDILSHGELLSTTLISAALSEAGIDHAVLPAVDFMQTDKYGEPLIGNIKVKLTQQINQHEGKNLFLTQGAHCRNIRGEVDSLGLGGSDYTAAAVAAALGATTCEIWSDIPGLQTNNATIISNTQSVTHLSFDEAAELAYFGEKILHPASVWPARHYDIPVKLLNSQQPAAEGTLITNLPKSTGARVVAARDGITIINIKSSRMLMAYGFLQKILEVFEKYKVSIDMVATSEVAVSVTIDNADHVHELVKELELFGVVTTQPGQTLISIVGHDLLQSPAIMAGVFNALTNIPLQILSYGGSKHNVSMLISSHQKADTLKALHDVLF